MALTTERANELLIRYGPNAIPPERRSRAREIARHFWGPVPWLLEATLVLLVSGSRFGDAIAVGFLLCFNALVAAVQEGRSRNAVELLQQRIVVRAHVKRDGSWKSVAAQDLVPGDLIHLGVGDVVPADAQVDTGLLDIDQSVLTGESAPRSLSAGEKAFAATTVTRGDATAVVTATGTRTAYGKTAELVRIAKSPGQLERLVLRLVGALGAISVLVIAAIGIAAWRFGFNAADIVSFAVMILLAAVPIALPAAFTVATTIGSLDLAKRGALVTRLSALEDAASMDVLCVDKTGTITYSRIAVESCVAFSPFTETDVALLAAAASDEATQDPIDLAVLRYARSIPATPLQRISFIAFDPARKYSTAGVRWHGSSAVVRKGAPAVLEALTETPMPQFESELERLATTGARVLAVAVLEHEKSILAGLIALTDPPRDDARQLVARLGALGVRVMMLTGDTLPTALDIAAKVGIAPDAVRASIYPEDKLNIVKSLQQVHAVVGMTGDGINDAPALRQANVGIAVSSATDVAKSAAGVVLTQPGLENIVAAIESGRAIFERMVTYTMMKLVKYFEIIGVLSIGFFVTKRFLMTPELLVALLVLNDFVTVSVSTDTVCVSKRLGVWKIGRLLSSALPISIGTAFAVAGVMVFAVSIWHVNAAQLRSVVFLSMVAMGQIALYVVRSRTEVFGPPPSGVLVAASCFAVVSATGMVCFGVLTTAVPLLLALGVLGLLCAAGGVLVIGKTLALHVGRRTGVT